MIEQLTDGYDVVVVGGGPAGLNGALMQARARCTVVNTGAAPAAQINADLVAEETRQAVEAHRVRLAVGAGSRDG